MDPRAPGDAPIAVRTRRKPYACRARVGPACPIPGDGQTVDRMRDIPPALEAAMDAYAAEAVEEAPALAEEQVRQLRAALRPEPVPGDE
jgi:hypothetical protein